MLRNSFRFWTICTAASAALFALALVIILVVPAGETQAQTGVGEVEGGGELQVDRRTQVEISGAYGHAGSLVAYKSERVASGRVVESRVVVNGKVLEVRKDLATRAITFDGHGNALSAAEAKALIEMVMEVGRTDIGVEGAPPQEDLLYRLIEYVSSASSGAVLGRYAVPEGPASKAGDSGSGPRQQTVEFELASSTTDPETVETDSLGLAEPLDASSGSPTSPEECNEAKAVAPWDVATVLVACQRGDDDGIAYLTCQNKNRAASYDGKNNCFKKFYRIYSGPFASRCKGRCGPGCNASRSRGQYTQDCLDHDTCCGRYGGCINGAFGSCADELREGRDDFFRARRNCADSA